MAIGWGVGGHHSVGLAGDPGEPPASTPVPLHKGLALAEGVRLHVAMGAEGGREGHAGFGWVEGDGRRREQER